MRVDEICPDKAALEDLVEIVTGFGGHQEVTPVGGIVQIVIVPGQETRPALEASGHTYGHMISHLHFHREVGSTGGVIRQVVAEGHFLRARIVRKCSQECKTS